MDHLPALPSAYDHGGALPYLPSASSAAYVPASSYEQYGGHSSSGVRSPPGSGSNAPYGAHAPYYASSSSAATPAPAKKKSGTPRRRAGADGEEPKPRKRKSVAAGELNPDGTPAMAPRVRKTAAPKLDEHGNPIPKKRRRKSGAGEGDDPATAGGSGGKKKGAAAASRKLQEAIGGYGDAGGSAAAAASSSQWDASALAGVSRGSTLVGRAPSAFHKDVMDLLFACGDVSRQNSSAALVLEDVLLELLSTLSESMLSMQPVNSTKDALQVAAQMANSRDGSGVAATTISTAHGMRMDTLLYSLRHYPQHYARVKDMWKLALQQQEAENQAKKAARQTQMASNK